MEFYTNSKALGFECFKENEKFVVEEKDIKRDANGNITRVKVGIKKQWFPITIFDLIEDTEDKEEEVVDYETGSTAETSNSEAIENNSEEIETEKKSTYDGYKPYNKKSERSKKNGN